MGKIKSIKKPGKKWVIGFVSIAIVVVTVTAVLISGGGGQNVEFKVLNEKSYPHEISSEVIPEYRSLERALACVVDKKIYVVVTRGEKPASGYKADIKKMRLESENGKTTLVVYAVFRDPVKNDSMSQVLTYPVKVAETKLKSLPDEIELRVQYEE